jgi:superfamily I DNA/RNA helicase/mRNA-degrading endonuclease RelE of RelBE toxin-antitoxin system
MLTAQVAISRDFMEALSRLPASQQKKTKEFLFRFRENPTSSGMNFERIESAVDKKVRSVRLDQNYRVIVVHPPRGDVFLCVWVDRHDEAYEWVRNRRFDVNAASGAMQIYQTTEMAETAPAASPSPPPTPGALNVASGAPPKGNLFADHDDEALLMVGVPAALLPSVRALETDDDLDQLSSHLPPDAAEMLYYLAAGCDLLQAIEESGRAKPPQPVEPDDFKAAIEHPESQRTFHLLTDDRDLEAILDAPLEQWRVFLHPTQRKLVEMHAHGPVRVLGGAGTGKTVALMHRASWLASNVFNGEDDRILVTTFTRNLALDLRASLGKLCPDSIRRLEVTNLHEWAMGFMRRRGVVFHMASTEQRLALMRQAVAEVGEGGHTAAFYRDEWDRVVQEQDVASLDDYLSARRAGRGVRLDRRGRMQIWPVLARYRQLLEEDGIREFPDLIRETLLFLRKQGVVSPYRAVLADEVQDFTPNELRLLRELAPPSDNSLFVVGDGHQRIYGRKTTLSSCGIDIRGRSRRLRLNYRTTEQIRRRAVNVLEGRTIDDLDGEADSLKGFVSLRRGPTPRYQLFDRAGQEAEAIVSTLADWRASAPDESICLAARTHAQLHGRYESILQDAGIPTVTVDKDPKEEGKHPGVRLATLHRLKGLEFRYVLLAGIQEGTMPLVPEDCLEEDAAAREDRELQERCLLYVGLTRARDGAMVTGYGRPTPFLD